MPNFLSSLFFGRRRDEHLDETDTLSLMRAWSRINYPDVEHIHPQWDGVGIAVIATGFTKDHDKVMVVFDGTDGAKIRWGLEHAFAVTPACVNVANGSTLAPATVRPRADR